MPHAGGDLRNPVAGVVRDIRLSVEPVAPDHDRSVGLQRDAEQIAGRDVGDAAGRLGRHVGGVGKGIRPVVARAPGNDPAVFQGQRMPAAGGNGRHPAGGGSRHVPNAVFVFVGRGDAEHLHLAVRLERHAVKAAGGHGRDAGRQRRRHVGLAVGVVAPRDDAAVFQRQRVGFAGGDLRDAARQRSGYVRRNDSRAPRAHGTIRLQRQTERSAAGHPGHAALRGDGHVRLAVIVFAPRPCAAILDGQAVEITRRDAGRIVHDVRRHGRRLHVPVQPPSQGMRGRPNRSSKQYPAQRKGIRTGQDRWKGLLHIVNMA